MDELGLSAGGTDYTDRAWDALYDTVDSLRFCDEDAVLIYRTLEKRLHPLSFGDYLKRYLYRKAALTGPFDQVPLKTYQEIIRDSFADNNTPASFDSVTAKISAVSKNWLTRQAVSRRAVFLLGFGLAMSAEDVNVFLTKALREQGIHAKNPFEVICWYCYRNAFRYPRFERLWNIYQETPARSLDLYLLLSDLTIGARNAAEHLDSDAALIAYVSGLKSADNRALLSVSARRCFDSLYARSRELAAALCSRETGKVIPSSQIGPGELERILSSAIPLDRHGNLSPGKASRLGAQFAGKRFNRQHIHELLNGRAEVTRFDLMTLNFFIYSQTLEDYPSEKARFLSFVDSTNKLLSDCFLGELNISHPYECFLLMCILSEDPLGTYGDVWELSYR